MVYVNNYKTMSKFVKFIRGKLWTCFWTQCTVRSVFSGCDRYFYLLFFKFTR